MEEYVKNEWEREGSFVYCLVENPKIRRKSDPPKINLFSFKVQRDNGLLTEEECARVATLAAASPVMLNLIKDIVGHSDRMQREGVTRTEETQIFYDRCLSIIEKAGG